MAATLTAEAIDKMTLPELRKHAAEQFEPGRSKGLKKAELQELLKSNLVTADDELDDDELDDDELDDDELDNDEEPAPRPADYDETPPKKETPPEPKGDTLTAKQVATRIGTDAKTLRKFFRSPASTVEAVGQGGRYEFAKADLPKIKAEFEKWNSTKPVRGAKKLTGGAKQAPATAVAEEIDEDDLELDDEEGPSDDELDDEDEVDDLELELDDEEEED